MQYIPSTSDSKSLMAQKGVTKFQRTVRLTTEGARQPPFCLETYQEFEDIIEKPRATDKRRRLE